MRTLDLLTPYRGIADLTVTLGFGFPFGPSTNRAPADVLVSCLHHEKIPAETLARYELALNFHPAPLPEYRGFAPYTFGILNGERRWGVSCHHMTAEIDAGPIVEVRRFDIVDPDSVTAAGLKEQTMPHLAELFSDVLAKIAAGVELPKLPNVGGYSYSKVDFERERTGYRDGVDDWSDLDRATRAFWCPPHAGLAMPGGFTLAPRCVAGEAAETPKKK